MVLRKYTCRTPVLIIIVQVDISGQDPGSGLNRKDCQYIVVQEMVGGWLGQNLAGDWWNQLAE